MHRLQGLLDEKTRQPEDVRRELRGELMPGFMRLSKLADALPHAARTNEVKALASEYFATVESWIEVCRPTVRVIDDPKIDPAEGFSQIRRALHRSAGKPGLAPPRGVDRTNKRGFGSIVRELIAWAVLDSPTAPDCHPQTVTDL